MSSRVRHGHPEHGLGRGRSSQHRGKAGSANGESRGERQHGKDVDDAGQRDGLPRRSDVVWSMGSAKLVELIRAAAREPEAGGAVGESCMTVAWSIGETECGIFEAMYHPSVERQITYLPHVIAPGYAAYDFSARPGPPAGSEPS